MESALALIAALAASLFAADLWRDYSRRPRPHIAAYGAGMTMFAIATWALFTGLTVGWTGPVYRTFYLFGAVLNILLLALGSMFLVAGRRAGHIMTIAIGAFAAISTTLTLTVSFQQSLPEGGIPHDMFASGFGPRLFAIIGGALGTTILVLLALISIFRFWKRNRRIVWGNLLIVAGTLAAAWGGTGLALGEASGFAFSLLLAVTLIWSGYRVASGSRDGGPPRDGEEATGQDGVHQFEGERS